MSDEETAGFHPVQLYPTNRRSGRLSSKVTMRAYEVYCHVYGPQEAMINDGCRGGFSIGEIIAFLYARSFPKAEWRDRVEEALKGRDLGS